MNQCFRQQANYLRTLADFLTIYPVSYKKTSRKFILIKWMKQFSFKNMPFKNVICKRAFWVPNLGEPWSHPSLSDALKNLSQKAQAHAHLIFIMQIPTPGNTVFIEYQCRLHICIVFHVIFQLFLWLKKNRWCHLLGRTRVGLTMWALPWKPGICL